MQEHADTWLGVVGGAVQGKRGWVIGGAALYRKGRDFAAISCAAGDQNSGFQRREFLMPATRFSG